MNAQLNSGYDVGNVAANFSALLAAGGAFFGVIPALVATLAGLLAIIWYAFAIHESPTMQKWMARRNALRKTRRLAKLKSEQVILIAEIEALEVVRVAGAAADKKLADAANELIKSNPSH